LLDSEFKRQNYKNIVSIITDLKHISMILFNFGLGQKKLLKKNRCADANSAPTY